MIFSLHLCFIFITPARSFLFIWYYFFREVNRNLFQNHCYRFLSEMEFGECSRGMWKRRETLPTFSRHRTFRQMIENHELKWTRTSSVQINIPIRSAVASSGWKTSSCFFFYATHTQRVIGKEQSVVHGDATGGNSVYLHSHNSAPAHDITEKHFFMSLMISWMGIKV